jgi:hypothetical protein
VSDWERKRVLITVKTYPTPAAKTAEQSCTAGVTDDGKWIRLFPIPWRFLTDEHKFRKWEWIDVSVKKASDFRPESHNPDCDSITVIGKLGTKGNWQERRDIISPLIAHCMCCLQKERNENKFPTFGLFRPGSLKRLIIVPEEQSAWTTTELEKLGQMSFRVIDGKMVHDTFKTLEKLPYKFLYEFVCDHDGCGGHRMSCTDWEMGQAYRNWRRSYGDQWEDKFRRRFEQEMIDKFDTHFFVGTTSGHPHVWVIVGTFRPLRAT